MSRKFVIGDIHGAYRALRQCLERSGFDYDNDLLISLGDVCDGWPETRQCVDEFLKMKNLVYVLGNHDAWALQWMKDNSAPSIWLTQGGDATVKSYNGEVPKGHIDFFENARHYFTLQNKLFVHAGFDLEKPIENQNTEIFLWDRNLAYLALRLYKEKKWIKLSGFEEVYIGHTPVPGGKPIHSCEVWLMDTGAGWSGPLTIMNVDTKEIFASDNVPTLYPGISGRQKG